MTGIAGILSIEERGGRETVDARGLHAALEVARDFSTWIKERIDRYGFQEGADYQSCSPDLGSEKHGGQNRVEYALSVSMAKELATVENNEAGRAVRRYLIQVEEAWNTPTMVLARAAQVAAKEVAEMRGRIALLEPRAAAADRIANASGLRLLSEVGKINGIGPRKIFELCEARGYIFRRRGAWVPFQDLITRGLMVAKERAIDYGDGDEHLRTQLYVTGKGEVWLAQQLFPIHSAMRDEFVCGSLG